jgi:hypothetical protein
MQNPESDPPLKPNLKPRDLPWQTKFHVGELLPWKGLWFRVLQVGERGLVLGRQDQ